ncbi:MAG: hypothetical protein ACRDQA_01400 [Nocardioidaceae bacterium]
MSEHENEDNNATGDDEPASERTVHLYGRGVRTALRNNATAYGFSISITAAYGLGSAVSGPASALETICFAAGAAVAFVLVGAVFITQFPLGSLPEGGQVATISGVVDLVSVGSAVVAAFGLAHVPGFAAWPLTALGTVIVYLLVGGLDVLIAQGTARRTSFARRQ